MSSTADEGCRSLSNIGLPRTDWESMFWAVFAASENPMAIADANRWVVLATARSVAVDEHAEGHRFTGAS